MILQNDKKYEFYLGDCLSVMREFPDSCINCIVTSPPYWGMRIYDNAEDENEVGNEKDFQMYVRKLTDIFTEARRILTTDGSLWLNLGDKYNNKALMGMPWRVAIALMDSGWILRNDVIWNQMKGTQSSKDRLRDSYEHFFHFVKSKKYYYDADSIRIKPTKQPTIADGVVTSSTGVNGSRYRKLISESTCLSSEEKTSALQALEDTLRAVSNGELNDFRMTIRGAQRAWHSNDSRVSGRAKELETKGFYIMKIGAKGCLPTDIWNIVPEDTWRKDNHCAVFPEELLRIPIIATCPQNGIVLDPFSGTGSTVSAALRLARRGVGIDLSEEYIQLSKKRVANVNPLYI